MSVSGCILETEEFHKEISKHGKSTFNKLFTCNIGTMCLLIFSFRFFFSWHWVTAKVEILQNCLYSLHCKSILPVILTSIVFVLIENKLENLLANFPISFLHSHLLHISSFSLNFSPHRHHQWCINILIFFQLSVVWHLSNQGYIICKTKIYITSISK